MAGENETTTNLRALRAALEAKRSEVATSAQQLIIDRDENEPAAGWQYGADIKVLQEQIDAVDRAIADEIDGESKREAERNQALRGTGSYGSRPRGDVA